MEMKPLWKSAQDADSHSGLEKPRQERSAFPHFHRPDDEIKSTEKNFRKYFCRTSRTELGLAQFLTADPRQKWRHSDRAAHVFTDR
jgi:hypothetical protein